MKAMYEIIDGVPYFLNQSHITPSTATFQTANGANSELRLDQHNKNVTQFITINTLKKPGTKSNAQMYKDLLVYLRENEITEIDKIQNIYKVYIDYIMYRDGVEIEHSQVIRPVESIDKALILGVATNNECVYRHIKQLDPTITFKMRNELPYGIMRKQNENYKLKICNIAIFQSTEPFYEEHNSIYNVSQCMCSQMVSSEFDNYRQIYSTYNEGIEIREIILSFMPRNISINMNILLTDFIVAYDDSEINSILIENINRKYRNCNCGNCANKGCNCDKIEAPDDGSNDSTLLPDKDVKPPANGDFNPDKNGYYDFYERCTESTPNALLVVEDMMSDSIYDYKTMIRKSSVIKDIEDIKVGEYVIYRESFTSDSITKEEVGDNSNG